MADRHWLMQVLLVDDWAGVWLAVFGLAAQVLFMSRMLVQWITSERARRSIIPTSFWWYSLAGATMLLAYGVMRRDVVIIVAQAFGLLVYSRNLYLIHLSERPSAVVLAGADEEAADG